MTKHTVFWLLLISLKTLAFFDSFDGNLQWKTRYRAQIACIDGGVNETPGRCLQLRFDAELYNGCGVELESPIPLVAGREYV
ncbi:MAG: hypothetical protein AB7F32_10790, partial [Victivallaceae bacterium]